MKLLRSFRADPYRACVLAAGLFWAALILQSLPYWDADYLDVFKAVLAKPLASHLLDVISPGSTDPQNWGFMDRTAQFAVYSVSHLIAGYNTWPYLLLRIFSLAGLGLMVYRWGLRLLPDGEDGRPAAAAAAAFLLVAPGPTASMVWLADFAPVTEFVLALLAYKVWCAIEETPLDWVSLSWETPERRAWLKHQALLTASIYLAYKTKADVKLLPAIIGVYLFATRRAQWKLFIVPVAAMAALAVPWSASLTKLPPFLPGSGGSATVWMWQPASLDKLLQYVWSEEPYRFNTSFSTYPLALSGLLGPFLLGALAAFLWWRSDKGTGPEAAEVPEAPAAERFGLPYQRARLFAAIWLLIMLAGMSALPPIPNYFRVRYSILPFPPVCILLTWLLGLFLESARGKSGVRLPRWAVAGFAAAFAMQFAVNTSRSMHYRRELGGLEIAVDKAYRYIDQGFPTADIALMPDFLAYSWRPDAVSPIPRADRLNTTNDLAARHKPGTLLLGWSASLQEETDLVEFFDGCRKSILFDYLMPCVPGTGVFLMRYIGPDPVYLGATNARATNNLTLARAGYEQFLSRHPANLAGRFWLGFAAWYLKDWTTADRNNSYVETYLPDNQSVLYNRALSLAALKQYPPAIERLERLVRMDPKNYGAQWNLYWAYRNAGKKDKALDTIAGMRVLFPADPEVNRLAADRF